MGRGLLKTGLRLRSLHPAGSALWESQRHLLSVSSQALELILSQDFISHVLDYGYNHSLGKKNSLGK